jgi:D-lactate dehydrogenase
LTESVCYGLRRYVDKMRITVFDTHKFERASLLAANNHRHKITFLELELGEQTTELARGADAITIFVNDDASASVLNQLAKLGVKYIALRSAGYNHIDLKRARELGLRVANVPAYSPYAVAEHTVALMLALNRKLIRANNRVKESNFSLDGLVGFDMNGKIAGIVGTGKIGAVVARILNGFGCQLLGFDPNPDLELISNYQLRYVDLETLCRESDIITLHAPLVEATKYIINEQTIALMKQGVMLVNTSRGALVKTRALLKALKSGQIGSLGLDVYEEEKGLFFHDHSDVVLQDDVIARLMTFPNVLITSHQGFLTTTALKNIAETTFYNINRWEDNLQTENEL